MRRSLEDRRLAVAAALRAVAAEPLPRRVTQPSVVDAVVGAVDTRLDELTGRLDEVLARLASVETALLESAWEQSSSELPELAVAPADDDAAPESTVTVPPVDDLAEARMSSVAAKALFGH